VPARTVEAARQERERKLLNVKRKIGIRELGTTRFVKNEKSFESARNGRECSAISKRYETLHERWKATT
jgi:hypothetical protein